MAVKPMTGQAFFALACEWLVSDTPTELEVRFTTDADNGTVVEIEHRGWERFGEADRDCAGGACPRPSPPRLTTGRSR